MLLTNDLLSTSLDHHNCLSSFYRMFRFLVDMTIECLGSMEFVLGSETANILHQFSKST
jgi:hypothetical protein